jgi:hypothetical protein
MLETEARKKWCPFTRVMTQFTDKSMAPTSGNRLTDNDGPGVVRGSQCIVSKCMAWRADGTAERTYEQAAAGVWPEGSEGGYCGLAGRPE